MGKNIVNEKGISILALLIIIVILLGIIGLAAYGIIRGTFFDAIEELSYKSEVTKIKKAFDKKKSEIENAEKNSDGQVEYELKMSDLDISTNLKIKFREKLVITKDRQLIYNPIYVKKEWEQKILNKIGINKPYSFTLNQIKETYIGYENGTIVYNAEKFWNTVGIDLSGKFGVDFTNQSMIGKMCSNSDKLPFVTEYNPEKEGDSAFSFGEKDIDGTHCIIIEIGYFNGKKSIKNHYTYEEILQEFGDVEIYFWSK